MDRRQRGGGMNVHVHIERLVVEGVAVDGARELEETLVARVEQMIASQGAVSVGADMRLATLHAHGIDLPARVDARTLGTLAAERLHGALAATVLPSSDPPLAPPSLTGHDR